MKKVLNILAGLIVCLALVSCSMTVPYAVTDAPIGPKKGVSKTGVILGTIQTNGNYGVAEAAKKGRIKGPISTVDVKTTTYSILSIFYYTKEIQVTGHSEKID